MENLIQVSIYIIAVFGIILTTMSFFEIYNSKRIIYNVFKSKKSNLKKVEIIVRLDGLSKVEENEFLEKLINGKYSNIKEIVDSMNIDKKVDI